jgi:hypothetical protein
MKKMFIWAMLMAMTITANAMSYTTAKSEALFLTDKMVYELELTPSQYEAVYEINLDYLLCIDNAADVFGPWWNRRNADLRYVLSAWQYEKYLSLAHFYRPVSWHRSGWRFGIYARYDRDRFFNHHPGVFATYRGGHNRMADRFYADRIANKPPRHHAGGPGAPHGTGSTWRHPGNNAPHPVGATSHPAGVKPNPGSATPPPATGHRRSGSFAGHR